MEEPTDPIVKQLLENNNLQELTFEDATIQDIVILIL